MIAILAERSAKIKGEGLSTKYFKGFNEEQGRGISNIEQGMSNFEECKN